MYSPLLSLLYSFVATSSSRQHATFLHSSTAVIGSCSFWHDATQVAERCQHDPPPADILKQIQEQPWRGGLEPVHPGGIPLHEAKVVEGKIPDDLCGMLCRNGPGRIRVGASQYGHWFDGDGLVSQLTLNGSKQKATFQAKYVETERFQAQQKVMREMKLSTDQSADQRIPLPKSGAWTKRGSKGSRWENLFAIPTNPANTNVIFYPNKGKDSTWHPRLYAIAEGGDPVLMDSQTLYTVGPEKITSKNHDVTSKSFFSAHYAVDPITTEIYNHGLLLGPTNAVNIMKLNPKGELIQQAATELESLCFIHDNALSENYLVLVVPPYTVDQSAFLDSLLGGEPLGKQFAWNAKNRKETTAMIFSKETLECVAKVQLPLMSTYHLIDAFEPDEEGKLLTFRALVHGPPASERIEVEKCFADLYRARKLPLCIIMEYTVDVESGTLKASRQVASNARPCELPDLNNAWGYKKRYVYTNTREDDADFTNSIQKVDLETGKCSDVISFGEGVYAGTPIFVPRSGGKFEDDGYVMVQLYRSLEHRSDVCILDTRTLKKLTLLQLESHVPYQFHGAWYPTTP
jgi:all-trans-8'-apo-beta-carotenal 15,15'-oxygenase